MHKMDEITHLTRTLLALISEHECVSRKTSTEEDRQQLSKMSISAIGAIVRALTRSIAN